LKPVEYQNAAEEDLIGAWIQVANDLGSDAADTYVSKIRDLCELIASQPGVARDDVAIGVRSLPVDNYVIFYENSDSSLRILRVWHSSQSAATLSI